MSDLAALGQIGTGSVYAYAENELTQILFHGAVTWLDCDRRMRGAGPHPVVRRVCWLTSQRHPRVSCTGNLLGWQKYEKNSG